MTDQQNQPTPEETYDFGGPATSYAENPWLDRTLNREAFYLGAKRGDKSEDMKKDGEARCFVVRRPQFKNIYAGVEAWMQVGLRDDLSVIAVPFYSAARLNEGWCYKSTDKKTGKVRDVLAVWNGPTKVCALARLTKARQDLIAPKKFKGVIQYWPAKDGKEPDVKRDYKKVFAIEAFEVLFEYTDVPDAARPGQTKRAVVRDQATGKPKFSINPRPYVLQLNDTWWEQYRAKILYPKLAQGLEPQVADIDGESKAKAPKPLPTTDPSQIVLKFYARTDEKDPSRAAYEIDFSPTLTIDSSAIVPEDPLPTLPDGGIDWNQVYVPMTQEQADKIIERADSLDGEMAGSPAPQPAPANAIAQGAASAPIGEDDIPF